MQLHLIRLGWLELEMPNGKYDEQTVLAIEAFQTYVIDNWEIISANWNEQLYGPIENLKPEINGLAADMRTLKLLFNEQAPMNPLMPVK